MEPHTIMRIVSITVASLLILGYAAFLPSRMFTRNWLKGSTNILAQRYYSYGAGMFVAEAAVMAVLPYSWEKMALAALLLGGMVVALTLGWFTRRAEAKGRLAIKEVTA